MASKSASGPFVQFQFCPLCRISHRKKRKHIYSKRHQTIVKNILDKYLKKITDARSTLDNPELKELNYESGAKFWCHFCVEEVDKHITLDVCILKYGQLLTHIASDEHKKKMWNFFYVHKVDEKQRHPDQFYLREELLERYKENAAKSIRRYSSLQEYNVEQITKKMKTQEVERQKILEEDYGKSQTLQNRVHIPQAKAGSSGNYGMGEKRATLMAQGEGLTFIGAHDYGEEEGNVHTGAPPPWLQPDNESNTTHEIGPTFNTYQKHLDNEKKKKLPACRVGAKFDHKSGTSEQWLPSFGRVWNKGRRLQSKQYFEKNIATKHHRSEQSSKASSTVCNNLPATGSSGRGDNSNKSNHYQSSDFQNDESYTFPVELLPRQVKPYQKKSAPIEPVGRQQGQIPMLISTPILKPGGTGTKMDVKTSNHSHSGFIVNNYSKDKFRQNGISNS